MSASIMKCRLNIAVYKCKNILLPGSIRYSSTNTLHNIKHEKEATLFRDFKLKVMAITGEPKISRTTDSMKLARVIEQAKLDKLSDISINSFLNKLKFSEDKTQFELMAVRGPGACILVVYILTNNIKMADADVRYQVKRGGGLVADSKTLNMFEYMSIIRASKDCNLEQALEDAIIINAEDVKPITDDGETGFEFKYQFHCAEKAKTQLINLGYKVTSMVDTCVPLSTVELNEETLAEVNKLKCKLLTLPHVINVEDNIA